MMLDMSDLGDISSDISSDIDAVVLNRDDVSNYNPAQILPLAPDDLRKIRSWLQPTLYDIVGGEYRKHLASHAAGTGEWLTSTATYQDWMCGAEHGMLWIKGIPGSGKSVMAANLIREIAKSNPGCPVLYFFFRQIIDANHGPQALLRDWMDQLLRYSPPLQEQLMTYVRGNRSIDTLSMEDMWKDLRMAFASLPLKIFAVGDALDEMDSGHDAFLKALGDLGRWRPETVKILITSRPVPSVEMPLRNHHCLHLRLEESLVDVDISTYVRSTLSDSEIPRSNWKVVADAVPGRANGLFLYAKLAMDAFLEPDADITTVLVKLPADLNALYTGLLNEHAERSAVPADVQHLILVSVTHATRPLRLLELAEMIRVCSPDGNARDLKVTKELIRTACGPLLEILADESVSVIHHSFTEYLMGGTTRDDDRTGHPVLKKGSAHTQLALACLCYLQSEHVSVESEAGHDRFNVNLKTRIRLEYPFHEYAANNWYRHINGSEAAGCDQSEINTGLRKYLGQREMREPFDIRDWPLRYKKSDYITVGHIAAQAGLISYTRLLLKTTEVGARDHHGTTPLYWAARGGHVEVIRELIAASAKTALGIKRYGSKPFHAATGSQALRAATRPNHSEAVKVLLEAGVDPLTPAKNDARYLLHAGPAAWTLEGAPLRYACNNGHLETVDVFMPFLKDVDTVHHALAWAAASGRSSVVARILQHPGVDVNAVVQGNTPLFLACGSYDLATITILLQVGANPNYRCEGRTYKTMFDDQMVPLREYGDKTLGYNCMHRLCGVRDDMHPTRMAEPDVAQSIFSLLLQHGADIHQCYPSGETALHGAVAWSSVLTRLLLDAGADANAEDDSGRTPLFKAGHLDCIVLLLEQEQVNINQRAADGKTPLFQLLSSSTSTPEMVLKFLEYEPDCDVVDSDGVGALHISLQDTPTGRPIFGNLEIIKALTAAGADPNRKTPKGHTPILMMRESHMRHREIFDTLLQAGADIDAVNKDGETLLFQLASFRHPRSGKNPHKDLRKLVDRGASPSSRDFKGRTLLHNAVYNTDPFSFDDGPTLSRFGYLLSLGLDVMAVDYRGNGLLHELALHGDEPTSNIEDSKLPPVWEHLLALGLDLGGRNHAGRTPLHLLCATTHAMSTAEHATSIMGKTARNSRTLVDLVISRTANIDAADQDGVTALHLAVTVGQTCAKKLLDAGADPTAATHKGLTPLHLASRCRDPNVVCLLLDALRRRQAKQSSQSPDDETLPVRPVTGVNARTRGRHGVTPLYYACRSGRPETVALLLEAGADVEGDTVFAACAEFEVEDALWWNPHPSEDYPGNGKAIALKLHDKSRRGSVIVDKSRRCSDNDDDSCCGSERLDPPQERGGLDANETTRLAEILDMVTKYGVDISQYDTAESRLRIRTSRGNPFEEAANANREYTAACLRDLRAKQRDDVAMHDKGGPGLSGRMFPSLRAVSVQVLRDSRIVRPGEGNQALLHRFLVRREYHLVEELARLGATFLPATSVPRHGGATTCGLGILIQHGFTSLFESVATLEAASRLRRGIWHAFGDSARPGLWLAKKNLPNAYEAFACCTHVPFILEAVQRKVPNMDILRLLVEKFGVDINERYGFASHTKNRMVDLDPGDSALHSVACGDSWWQVHQALPYLLKAGADLHARNDDGQTPLQHALKNHRRIPSPFNVEAVRTLVSSGVDVNAVDYSGQSCLALAMDDIGMIKYLISNGATVTPDALLAAVDNLNPKILRVLLSTGVDPNARQDKAVIDDAPGPKYRRRRWRLPYHMDGMEPDQIFPLCYAAWGMRRSPWLLPQDRKNIETRLELVRALLDHGADPFSKFLKSPNRDMIDEANGSGQVPPGDEELTILHQLLSMGFNVDTFLDFPGLDVNSRDARGRTLLLAACNRNKDFAYHMISSSRAGTKEVEEEEEREQARVFQRLLSLGAELTARDNSGRNVLHHMISAGSLNIFSRDSIAYTLARAPGLVKQADSDGKTPLQHAVSHAHVHHRAGLMSQLLAAGADPFVVNKDGDTVLHSLARNLGLAELRTLFADMVSRGVDINARNDRGETPLFAYCQRAEGRTDSPLWYETAKRPFLEEPEFATPMLVELQADFTARDSRGRGLLHVAASGDGTRFKELMGFGLDVMLEDEAQRTPVDVANVIANDDVLGLFDKDGGEERSRRRRARKEKEQGKCS